MNVALERLVWQRANDACEYCRMPQALDAAPFQIDHIIAHKHGGVTEAENLALACLSCNLFKGPNIAGIDAETGAMTRLFHPRNDDRQQIVLEGHLTPLPSGHPVEIDAIDARGAARRH
ncbi:MAG: hypothetical protein B7Z73_19520, partial [Planctomycetia bacterium 21-64-5]